MIITDLVSNMRIELQDIGEAIWTEDELIRAIGKSVALMSRLLPKRSIAETTLVREVAGETLTITSSTGTLAYKPVKEDSLTIPGKTKDTHYRLNHLTGVVTSIGAGLPDTDYTVAYSLDPHMFDLSSLLTDYVKIERVEYPLGSNPAFELWGTYMLLRTPTLTDKKALRVIYLVQWTPPSLTAEGDFPSHLNNSVIIGSSGQALIYKAEKYMHDTATALESITTALAGIDNLSLNAPSLTPPTAPTLSTLTPPTSYTVVKPSAPNLPTVPTPPTAPTLSFTTVETALAKVASEIASGTLSAEKYLAAGDDLINVSTRGENVGATYGQYAVVKVSMAQGYINEAIARLKQQEDVLSKYSSEVASFGSKVNAYANEVSGTVGKYREQINAETLGINNVGANVAKYSAEIQEQYLKISKYAEQVRSYQTEVAEYQAEVASYNAKATAILQRAAQVGAQVANYLDLAGRYLGSGQAKIQEFLLSLGYKVEFAQTKASAEQRG